MDIREQSRITKKPETIRSLQQQAEAETEREAKASAYLPTLDEIAEWRVKLRAEREARERESDAKLVREFLDDDGAE